MAGDTRPTVLMTVHSAKLGGAERMALLEAQRFAAWAKLIIAVPSGSTTSAFARCGRVVARVPSLPLWGGAPRFRWVTRTARTAIDVVRLSRLIRRERVRVVVVNSAVSLSPVLAARLAGVPAVVHVRDTPFSRLSAPVLWAHGRYAHTLVLIAEAMRDLFPAPRARTIVIHDGIPADAIGSGTPPRRDGGPRLCVVGALNERKGQHVAVEALAQINERGAGATLDLIGRAEDPEYESRLRARVRELGLAEAVTFAGEIQGAGALLGKYDMLVVPSNGEWTPLTIMEALLQGVPVVATQVGGVPELLANGKLGTLVPKGDAEALAAAVLETHGAPELQRRVAVEGPCHVRAHYSIENMLEATEGYLRRLTCVDG